MVKRSRVLAAGAALGASLVACQLILGVDDRAHPFAPGAGVEAGAPDAPPESSDAAAACTPKHAREPPTNADPSEKLDLVFAVTRLDFTDPSAGFDLDDQCTCFGDPPSGSCRSKNPQCDFDGGEGVDNSMSAFLQTNSALTALLGRNDPLQINSRIADGEVSILLRIQDYGAGDGNDPKITFSTYPSNGTVFAPDGGYTKPSFDGNDLWTVDPTSVSDAGPPDANPWDLPQFTSLAGYVNGGFFVVRNFALRLGLGDLSFDLSNAVLTGQIVRATAQNKYFITKGTIAARVTASSFLRGLTALKPGSTNSLCPESSSGYFNVIKSAVCPNRDVQSDPQASPQTPCDALSFGITFEAYEARIAEVRGRPSIVSPCVDSGAAVFECPPP